MKDQINHIFFSIIIPTRNRPELFKLALNSVASQNFDKFEIIVVNDGSTDEFLAQYEQIKADYCNRPEVRFFDLVHRPNGHGQSYSMNYGVSKASGDYIGFMDDDDYWIDDHHLARAFHSIQNASQQVDVYYTNQDAFFSDGSQQQENVWIEDLTAYLDGRQPDSEGSYLVDIHLLLKSGGFAHLNCTIIRKCLYERLGGMDENIRYECDRDIYIRTIDAASCIYYNPNVISKHNIPDQKKKDNMSTLVATSEKLIYQLRVYDKGIASSEHDLLVEYCSAGKMYVLKKLAEEFKCQQQIRKSYLFASQALALKFSMKWWLFTVYLKFKLKLGL